MHRVQGVAPAVPAGRTHRSAGSGLAAPAVLLFLSGTAALVFQVLWVRQLTVVVGVEARAIATAISAYFLGMALGSWLWGRRADPSARPLRVYAGLEAVIAVACVATTLLLAHGARAFAVAESHHPVLAWLPLLVVVGAAPLFMGGTLPLLVSAFSRHADGRAGHASAVLYAANTTGAILGALLPTFLLIPSLGIHGTAWAGAALNGLAAAGAWRLARAAAATVPGVPPPAPRSGPNHAARAPMSRDARCAVALYGVSGAVAIGYETLWSQMVVQFMSTRAYAFAVLLAVYLAGIALGAALYARWDRRVRHPWRVFGMLILAAGLVTLLQTALLGPWIVPAQARAEAMVLALGAGELAGMAARFFVAAAALVLIPTMLLGAAFPAVVRIAAGEGGAGRAVGATLASNTLGGIVGTVLSAFVLLPALGLVHTQALLAAVAAATGLCAVWRAAPPRAGVRATAAAMGVVALVLAFTVPADRLARLLPAVRNGKLVFYEETGGGTVAVVEQGQGDNRFRRLYIQGVSNSGDAMPSLRYMRLQALLPLIVHDGQPRSALVIGLGTGITAGALSQYPDLERRVVAELLPAVVRAAPQFRGTFLAHGDPGLEIRLRDGRRELLASPQRYDLITLEPPPPSAAGVANLYSTDFYRLAARRLQPQGIVAQWLPLPTQNEAETRSLIASFIQVFPYASLWTTELHETLLVGSMQPMPLDAARIQQRYAIPETRRALEAVGVDSAAALLATWVMDRDGLQRYAGDAPAVTDDRPRIEYGPWVRPREITRVLPALMRYREPVPLSGADDALLAGIAAEREKLDVFYGAALAAYRGDRQAWARDVARLADAPMNAYVRWFIGR